MKIKYVGLKEGGETAFSELSGIERWMPGDTYEVKDDAAKRMLQHPDIWAIAEDQKPSAEAQPTESGPQVAAISLPDGTTQALDGMSKEALHELAKALGVRVHHLSGSDKVTKALVAAFPVKA